MNARQWFAVTTILVMGFLLLVMALDGAYPGEVPVIDMVRCR